MTGYNRIARQNPKIIFYDTLSDITRRIPILGKNFEALLRKKKIAFIQKQYPTFSFQIRRVLDCTATPDEILRLYEKGIPLIDDYMICLKHADYFPKECLDYLNKWNCMSQQNIRDRESDCGIILDVILACHKKVFSSGWDVVCAYILGFLSKTQALAKIKEMRICIPETTKLIEMECKDSAKIEETYYKEAKI